jgi:hypothetical protein
MLQILEYLNHLVIIIIIIFKIFPTQVCVHPHTLTAPTKLYTQE